MRSRYVEAGLDAATFEGWFAAILRDGFAAAAAGGFAGFRAIATHQLTQRLEAAGLDHSAEVVDGVIGGFQQVEAQGDVAEGLQALRHAGVRVVTMTNGTAEITRTFLERAGLAGLVEDVLDVAEAGIWKPHPDAYHHVAGRLGTRPADTALVAVHPWDVQGARRAGLVGAWVNRSGAEWPAYFDEPDVRGASLGEVASRLTSGAPVPASST